MIGVTRANQSPEIIKALGGGEIRVNHVSGRMVGVGLGSGSADLTIDIAGAAGSGKLLEWAQNGFPGWHLCSLSFVNSDGREIVIMPDEKAKCERE